MHALFLLFDPVAQEVPAATYAMSNSLEKGAEPLCANLGSSAREIPASMFFEWLPGLVELDLPTQLPRKRGIGRGLRQVQRLLRGLHRVRV